MQPELEVFYRNQYRLMSYQGAGARASAWFHTILEKQVPNRPFRRCLEVGAGSGEHLRYVKHDFEFYIQTDLLVYTTDSTHGVPRSKVWSQVADAEALPFRPSSFDRVIATCLLHHLTNPQEALREWRRVCRPGGMISILIPSDPGFLYRASRVVSEVLRSRAMMQDLGLTRGEFKYLHAIDHRNHAASLVYMVQRVFHKDQLSLFRLPISLPFWNLILATVVHVTRRDSA